MLTTNTSPFGSLQTDYHQYIMDPGNVCVEMRKGGRFNQSTILKYQDGTEWVFLNNIPIERFCGFLYLQKALLETNLPTIQAAENKIALHDRKVIYLSRWRGDEKPGFMEHRQELSALAKAGFIDTAQNANLRVQDGVVFVFDTEKSSFDASVHEKIDAFISQHDLIRSAVEKLLI